MSRGKAAQCTLELVPGARAPASAAGTAATVARTLSAPPARRRGARTALTPRRRAVRPAGGAGGRGAAQGEAARGGRGGGAARAARAAAAEAGRRVAQLRGRPNTAPPGFAAAAFSSMGATWVAASQSFVHCVVSCLPAHAAAASSAFCSCKVRSAASAVLPDHLPVSVNALKCRQRTWRSIVPAAAAPCAGAL